ncbi:hypothetical protein BIV24_22285 [Streptomyces colonosanans]|uniref:Uncharacterized protein n=1 Tax=Streptomyces colonosanans TaxID=1428652 RepID=A0A1S2P3B4_9ACTN|nr:hypothetical protein BIV24_22285 [Streptomyces colonosanans]
MLGDEPATTCSLLSPLPEQTTVTFKLDWDVVSTADGDVMAGGSDILMLDEDGRIKTDYMFPGP